MPLAQVWPLAQAWYGDRMHPDYRGRTIAQALHIFDSVGLRSDFWQTPVPRKLYGAWTAGTAAYRGLSAAAEGTQCCTVRHPPSQ